MIQFHHIQWLPCLSMISGGTLVPKLGDRGMHGWRLKRELDAVIVWTPPLSFMDLLALCLWPCHNIITNRWLLEPNRSLTDWQKRSRGCKTNDWDATVQRYSIIDPRRKISFDWVISLYKQTDTRRSLRQKDHIVVISKKNSKFLCFFDVPSSKIRQVDEKKSRRKVHYHFSELDDLLIGVIISALELLRAVWWIAVEEQSTTSDTWVFRRP